MYRFAPSKDMHIENLQIALFNFICAKQDNVPFVLRIENADKTQNLDDEKNIELLKSFGLTFDKPLYQSNNLKFYLQFASTLLQSKKAFSCFCTETILDKKRQNAQKNNETYSYDGNCKNLSDFEVLNNEKPFSIRIKRPKKAISFTDTLEGDFTFKPEDIDDFTIMKKNKYPTYNFACSIDDMLQNVSCVIQSQTQISNVPKQILVRKSLGYDKKIKYTHVPTIKSKKNNISNVSWLINQGFLPQAIANYLILLGNKTPKEIFTLNEAISWFDLKNLSKDEAKFDLKQLKHINCEHIKLLSDALLASFLDYSSKDIGQLAKIYTKEVSTINEIKQKIDAIFSPKNISGKFESECKILLDLIQNAPYFEKFDEFKSYLMEKSGLKGKNFSTPLKILFTNTQKSPALKDIYDILKKHIKEVVR